MFPIQLRCASSGALFHVSQTRYRYVRRNGTRHKLMGLNSLGIDGVDGETQYLHGGRGGGPRRRTNYATPIVRALGVAHVAYVFLVPCMRILCGRQHLLMAFHCTPANTKSKRSETKGACCAFLSLFTVSLDPRNPARISTGSNQYKLARLS